MAKDIKQYPMTVPATLKKIADDLAWRGPGGRGMGHITLHRTRASMMLDCLEAKGYLRVYVVMGNDYPDAVFTNEAAALRHCEAKTKLGRADVTRIHWRYYDFMVQTE
jgi:hypothetical protein